MGETIRRSAVCAAAMCATTFATAGENTWTTAGPYGGATAAVQFDPFDPSVAYALGRSVPYKSTDAGVTWAALSLDARGTIGDLDLDLAHPGRLYAVSMDGLFRSNDRGTSFQRLSVPFRDNTTANQIGPVSVSVSNSGQTIFVVMQDSSTYISTDAGETFSARAPVSAFMGVRINPANESIFYAMAPGPEGGLLVSKDAGATWNSRPMERSVASFLELTTAGTTTLWRSAGDGIVNSSDEGESWTVSLPISSLSTPFDSFWLGQAPANSNVLYAGSYRNAGPIFRYAAGSWQQLPNVPADPSYSIAQPSTPSSTMLASTKFGLLRSDDAGTTWATSDQGLTNWVPLALTASKSKIFALHDGYQLASTTGAGAWEHMKTPALGWTIAGSVSLAAHPADPDLILVGTSSEGIYRSTDGGETWSALGAALAGDATGVAVSAIAFGPDSSRTVYASHTKNDITNVMRSINNGEGFGIVSESPLPLLTVSALVQDPHAPGHLLLAGRKYALDPSGVFRSTDGGAHWTQVVSRSGPDLTFDSATPGRAYAASATSGMLVTDDGGATWKPLTTYDQQSFGYAYDIEADPRRGGTLYVAALLGTHRILRSVDSGRTWEIMVAPAIPRWQPTKIAIAPDQPSVVHASAAGGSVYSFELAPDLALMIEGHSGQKAVNAASTFTTRVQNTASLSATEIELAITLPSSLQNVSANVSSGACSIQSNVARCSVPFLHGASSAVATVTYTATVAGAIEVSASVSARERDPQLGNNVATATASASVTTAGSGSGGGGGGGSLPTLILLALASLRALRYCANANVQT